MSFSNKEFDFFGKMNKNIEFYILENNSEEKNYEIKEKITKYQKAPEFFKYYLNKNIEKLFAYVNKLDKIYSDLYNVVNSNDFKSKIDKYISDLSNIIVLFNLISKNQQIIDKTILNSELYLKNIYLENQINNETQQKLNSYIKSLLHLKKRKAKRYLSLISNDKIVKKYRNKTVKAGKHNIFVLNKKEDEKIVNSPILNQKSKKCNRNYLKEEKSENPEQTPEFQLKRIEDDDTKNESNIMEETNKNTFIKQGSIQSFYTLAPRSNIVKSQDEKTNNSVKEKQESQELKINLKNNDDKKKKRYSVICSSNLESKTNEAITERKLVREYSSPKGANFSSLNLNSAMKNNLIKDFLCFINHLYKDNIINSDEKIKLKHLIISETEKIEDLSPLFYQENKEKFIIEIKKLIINE